MFKCVRVCIKGIVHPDYKMTHLFPYLVSTLWSASITLVLSTEIQDDDNSLALIYQTISELPQPNRDTLAYLAIHLKRYGSASTPSRSLCKSVTFHFQAKVLPLPVFVCKLWWWMFGECNRHFTFCGNRPP